MSLIALVMNLVLVALLAAALAMGWRLNRRLKVLRDSHDGFTAAVAELNLAAQRAEQGLADLRAATDEATDLLSDRIEKGRQLAARLERLIRAAPEAPPVAARPAQAAAAPPARAVPPVTPPRRADTAEDRLGALLAAAREARARPERLVPGEADAAPPPRRPPSIDDDLFDDEPLTLNRYAGARR